MSVKARAFQLACRSRFAVSQPGTGAVPTSSLNTSLPQPTADSGRHFSTQNTHAASSGASSSAPSRRSVTVTTDDGRYDWSELSTGEKAARTTQQSFNTLLVAAALTGTCLVSYYLYTDLFSADSYTVLFNSAVDRIKASADCRAVLGPSSKIVAFGEPTSNKWARARPIAHTEEIDRLGTKHVKMHFNVEGPDARGVVNVHLSRTKEMEEKGEALEWRTLSLSIPGQETIYLENKDAHVKGKVSKMFGVQWR